MKVRSISKLHKGLTLVELALVIGILLALLSIGMYSSSEITKWRKGREAAESLRAVYAAQRTYMADHPTAAMTSLTEAELIPYLPGGVTTMPTAVTLKDEPLVLNVTASPPYFTTGGTRYDPSGSNSDSLWDVGE